MGIEPTHITVGDLKHRAEFLPTPSLTTRTSLHKDISRKFRFNFLKFLQKNSRIYCVLVFFLKIIYDVFSLLFCLQSYSDFKRCSRGHGRLDVMAIEVALQVEVGQVLVRGDRQQGPQRRIRVDGMLVLQVVRLHVLVHGLGDLGARHQGARRAAQKGQQLSGHLSGALEDRRRALDLYTVLIQLNTAAALAGILHLTVYTLLQLLDLGEQRGGGLAEGVQVGRHRLEVIIQRGGGHGGYSRSLHGGRSYNDGGYSLGLRGALGYNLLGRLNGGGHGGGGGLYRHGGINLLLCDTLGGLGGGGNSRHYTGRRGNRTHLNTHYLTSMPCCNQIL